MSMTLTSNLRLRVFKRIMRKFRGYNVFYIRYAMQVFHEKH